MEISTTRFGNVTIEKSDMLTFADGLIGMEDCRRWVLLADSENLAIGWLQSLDRPELAVAVVSPRRVAPDYQIRVPRREIEALGLDSPNELQVLAIVSQTVNGLAVNLKAPLVIHVDERLGRQVIARDDHPLQQALWPLPRILKTA